MTKTFKAIFAACLALALIVAAMPLVQAGASAKTLQPSWTVPAGYNENDYNRIAAFLETADENGVKNGMKLSSAYDPSVPSSWGMCYDPDYYTDMPTFQWEQYDGEYRVRRVCIFEKALVGTLDFSNFAELFYVNCANNALDSVILSGCAKLWTLDLYGNGLAAVDLSELPMLHFLRCDDNALTSLDISHNPDLVYVDASFNRLETLDVSPCPLLESVSVANNLITSIDVSMLSDLRSLDVSGNALTGLDVSENLGLQKLHCSNIGLSSVDISLNESLSEFFCVGNPMTEIDMAANPILMLDTVKAESGGSVGCLLSGWFISVHASAAPGYAFEGWYDAAGELISTRADYEASELDGSVFIARFVGSGALMGDADGDGRVTVSDAALTLRNALGLIGADALNTANADMNGDGSISATDAVMILRVAMGLSA